MEEKPTLELDATGFTAAEAAGDAFATATAFELPPRIGSSSSSSSPNKDAPPAAGLAAAAGAAAGALITVEAGLAWALLSTGSSSSSGVAFETAGAVAGFKLGLDTFVLLARVGGFRPETRGRSVVTDSSAAALTAVD